MHGNDVKRIALGTAQFGQNYGIANQQGQIDIAAGNAILAYALAQGVDTLDTAIDYGKGESERRLGQAGVQGWKIISKLPGERPEGRGISEWVTEAVHGSLGRLKVNSLYGFLLHRSQQLVEQDGDQLYRTLQQLKQDGLIKKIGVSIYDPEELDALSGRYQVDLVQAPFNILDRRLIDSGWLSRLAEQGTELHVRSIFLQGLLLMASGTHPKKFARWQAVWDRWEEWLRKAGLTPVQACLRYVMTFPQIDKLVVGVDSLSHLTGIIKSLAGPLPHVPDHLRVLDRDLINPTSWKALA